MRLLVMIIAVAVPVLLMPVTICVVLPVDALEACKLFTVVILPMVFESMVTIPSEDDCIPMMPVAMVVVELVVVIEPILLLRMVTIPRPATPIPLAVAPLLLPVTKTEPLPVALPMVLPVMVPTFAFPAAIMMPLQMPLARMVVLFVLEVLVLVNEKLAMVFPCTEEAIAVSTDRPMPLKRFEKEPPIVQAAPPQFAALPPMKLLATVKLFPEFELEIPIP